jgi:CRISPR-associated endonuclease Cas2
MSVDAKNISRTILKGILVGGAFAVASTSPTFAKKMIPALIADFEFEQKRKRKQAELDKFYNSFYYLRKKGLLKMEYRGKQLHVSLSEEGKVLAKKYSIDELKIKKPAHWDKKWRILIFDIEEKYRSKREMLRGKLKELGLFQLQKSVWVCPYHFQEEVQALRDFFDFNKEEMTVIIASEIEKENELITFFDLKSNN